MPRIQLIIYLDPSSAEVFVNLKRKDGTYQRLATTVDTGAEVSLLPQSLLQDIDYRLVENGKISVEQVGIARQSFEATEAFVTLFLEDQYD